MPQHRDSGTVSEPNPPYASVDEVPIMANYLPSYNITLNHRSESNSGEQPAGASLPVQHAQGVMDDTPEHPCITQIPVACEAGESTG